MNSLFKRFIILSFISVFVIGALLAYFVSGLIERQEVNRSIEVIDFTLNHSLDHWFEEVDLDNLSRENIIVLNDELHHLNELGDFTEIRIWSLQGELLYSFNNALIGTMQLAEEHLTLTDEQSENFHYWIVKHDPQTLETEKNKSREYLQLLLPIVRDEEKKGVFEIYRVFDTSRKSIQESAWYVIGFMVMGLILLYFLLARIIYTSSSKLISQNEEIKQAQQEVELSYVKLKKLNKDMIHSITNAIDARDKFTSGHSERVTNICVSFTDFLGKDADAREKIEKAALLHDIGKLGVPESIIHKQLPLEESEIRIMQNHPTIGAKIVEGVDGFESVLEAIMHHHERYDGKGYPHGLAGEDIPEDVRIITIVDSFDAMVSNRPYRSRLTEEKALKEIADNKGLQFDPELAQAFIEFWKNHHSEQLTQNKEVSSICDEQMDKEILISSYDKEC